MDLYTPLHRLVEIYDPSRHASVAALLLEHGADPNASQPALDGSLPEGISEPRIKTPGTAAAFFDPVSPLSVRMFYLVN